MTLLEMKDIRKSFDGLGVLDGISLSVRQGEVVAVIGPSGSGKSTFLRCATFLEDIDSGEIVYGGRKAAWTNAAGACEYASAEEMRAFKSYFGLVFQSFNLFPHFTVLKNVTDAPLVVQKRDKAEVRETAMQLLGKMGLADKAGSYPFQLSGGQQQRVFLARALAQEAEVYFMDEPFKGVDARTERAIVALLKDLKEQGKTVVVVHHDLQTVPDYFDWVTLINLRVVASGPVDEVFHEENLKRTYHNSGALLRSAV